MSREDNRGQTAVFHVDKTENRGLSPVAIMVFRKLPMKVNVIYGTPTARPARRIYSRRFASSMSRSCRSVTGGQ
jgi:hypothetical protein